MIMLAVVRDSFYELNLLFLLAVKYFSVRTVSLFSYQFTIKKTEGS